MQHINGMFSIVALQFILMNQVGFQYWFNFKRWWNSQSINEDDLFEVCK